MNANLKMTDRQEYMSNVRWTTALYIGASTISIVIAIAGVYYGLKGDIKDSRTESREQITAVANMLNRKMDSINHVTDLKIQQINMKLGDAAYTEKKKDGSIYLVPIK